MAAKAGILLGSDRGRNETDQRQEPTQDPYEGLPNQVPYSRGHCREVEGSLARSSGN